MNNLSVRKAIIPIPVKYPGDSTYYTLGCLSLPRITRNMGLQLDRITHNIIIDNTMPQMQSYEYDNFPFSHNLCVSETKKL